MKRLVFLMTIAAGLAFLAQSARADDYALSIKNQSFTPQTLIIPANQKVKIIVKNLDTTPAEFESSDLDREKVVTAGGQIDIYVGPLDPGGYKFFNDFHRESTGTIIVK